MIFRAQLSRLVAAGGVIQGDLCINSFEPKLGQSQGGRKKMKAKSPHDTAACLYVTHVYYTVPWTHKQINAHSPHRLANTTLESQSSEDRLQL